MDAGVDRGRGAGSPERDGSVTSLVGQSGESTRDAKWVRPSIVLLMLGVLAIGGLVALLVPTWEQERGRDDSRSLPGPDPGLALPEGNATLAEIARIRDDFYRNAALYRLADGATKEQVNRWLDEVTTLEPMPHRYDVARVLYIRYAVLDPEAAVEHALRNAAKPAWLAAIFRTWAQLDADSPIERASTLHLSAKAVASRTLLQLGSGTAVRELVAERLDATEGLDAYRRMEAMAGVPLLTPAKRTLAEIEAGKLARRDGESHADAWNRAVEAEDVHVRQILTEQTALDWAMEDPWAALATLDSLPVDDLVATVRGGGSMSVWPLHLRIRTSVIEQWSDDHPDAVLAWLLDWEGGAKGWYIQRPMIALTRLSPEEAIARLAAIPHNLRQDATGAVIRTLAHRDLDRALRLYATLDIASKADHTHTLRRRLIENRSAEEALRWALTVDHRILAREVPSVIADVHGDDHVKALRLLESVDDPALRIAAADRLVRREARRDAREALAWAQNFHPQSARPALVAKVFDTWAHKDPKAAGRALLELRGGPVRDRAAAALMSDMIRHDVYLAERLFEAIETPVQQAEAATPLHAHFTDIAPNRRKAERYRKYLPDEDGEST